MLIMNKSKNKIFNLDNVECIDYSIDNRYTIDSKPCTIRLYRTPTQSYELGLYWKHERCEEILIDIMKKANVGERVFYMPEE